MLYMWRIVGFTSMRYIILRSLGLAASPRAVCWFDPWKLV